MNPEEFKKIIANYLVPHLVGIRDEISEQKASADFERIKAVVLEGKPGADAKPLVAGIDYPSREQFAMMVSDAVKESLPKLGIDYFTEDDMRSIVSRAAALIPRPEDGKDGEVDYSIVESMVSKASDGVHSIVGEAVSESERRILESLRKAVPAEMRPERLRDMLESLQGSDRLDAKAIKGLERYVSTFIASSGGGGGGNSAIGSAVSGADEGSVLFAGPLGVLSQDNANLHWDNSSKRLGIGTDSPVSDLHVAGTVSIGTSPNFSQSRLLKVYDDGNSGGARVSIIGTSGVSNTPAVEFVIDGNIGQRSLLRLTDEGSNDYGMDFVTTSNGNVAVRMQLTGDGLLGIGTTSPAEKLHVSSGNVKVSNAIPYLMLEETDSSNKQWYVAGNGGRFFIADGLNSGDQFLEIFETGNVIMGKNGGNLGVGTTSPLGTLHVSGSSTAATFLGLFAQNGIAVEDSATGSTAQNKMVSVQGNGAAYFMGRDVTNNIEFVMGTSTQGAVFVGSMTNHDLHLRTDNDTVVWIKSNERVGIGVSNPTSKLEVDGDIEIPDSADGLILKSPLGTRWRVQITDAGALTATSL